jgi:hypothetical protein
MVRHVASFLIRLWRADHAQRIEIEHIQSGEKGLVTSVADALDWITARTVDEQLDLEQGDQSRNRAIEPQEEREVTREPTT